MKRFASLIAAAGAAAAVGAFALAGGASGAPALPTINIALTGAHGITVSGSEVSGAVNIVSTFSGKAPHGGSYGLVRLNPNEPPAIAAAAGFNAVQSHHGDLNALTATGDSLVVSADAPGTIQTVLVPGNYVALNTTGMGPPGHVQFTVTPSPSPAALPAANAVQAAIEFGFRGPATLHNGTMVRSENAGFLVHMIDLIGARSKADAKALAAGLRAGLHRKALKPFLRGIFLSLLDPASPGAVQQAVLHTKPGWYVEACFMNTQDGREHTQLGMERVIHVVK